MNQNDPDFRDRITSAAPTDWIDGHPQLEAIAAAVWERCEHHDSGLIIDDPRNIAVAALAAVLPTPDQHAAVRAAALHEDADALEALDPVEAALAGQHAWADGAALLRRLAGEAPQDKAHCVCGEPTALGTVHRTDGPCHVREAQQDPTPSYPYPDGDVTVLGPEVFASKDGGVICWKGENYERQPTSEAQQAPAPGGEKRVKHSGPTTKFCVLCLSGEHERVDDAAPARSGQPEAD
ncbi:hypothetical protein ACL07V_37580 [Streptomyces sp. MB22_4]|uniref:hypothetical protein n=1 Tax=Streptomyces sp. MB22_4 TaxID=3383120 RepID=UPI0039A041FB